MPTEKALLGNIHDALRASARSLGLYDCDCGCATRDDVLYARGVDDNDPRLTLRVIGRGESRTAYLVNDVVYKIGRDSANEYEHKSLSAWRDADANWAPETHLYRMLSPYGDPMTAIAMTYLPDDGSALVNSTELAKIRQAAPQACRENWTVNKGQPYLIDGVDIERFPGA